jgi:DNA repair exonuclease SbcCD ATPase subunit
MEICLQEAQAAREQSIARMKEQYDAELSSLRAALTNEVESARAENQALLERIGELERARSSADRFTADVDQDARRHLTDEITRLRSTLAQQEYTAARQAVVLKAEIDRLAEEIERCRDELARHREISNQASAELERLRTETAALTERSPRSGVERGGADEFADRNAVRLGIGALISELAGKIHQLQLLLLEKQSPSESRAADLMHLKAELKRVVERLAVPDVFAGVKPGHANFDAASSGRRIEETTMTPMDGNKQLPGDALESSQPSATQAEQSLRDEIERLLHEARERNRLLQDRNDELVRVKSEMDRLQERLNQLESFSSSAQSVLAGDAARMHTEFQAQLALLQAELSQKQWALEEKEAAVRGLEQKYREEIATLRRQVTRPDSELDRPKVAIEPRLNPTEEESPAADQNAEARAREMIIDGNRRRWHSGFGRKRRWR